MTADRDLSDYVDVAERITEFRDKHPGGCLQPADPDRPYRIETITGADKDGQDKTLTFIVYVAAAYRTPDDPRPGIGTAYEVFPGRTPYTRGSELQNAETAAWGRAITAALAGDARRGIANPVVASTEEARNRRAEAKSTRAAARQAARKADQDSSPRVQAARAGAGHERLRAQTLTKDRPADRTPPEGDGHRWTDKETGEVVDWSSGQPEDRPGSIMPGQHRAIERMLGMLGFKPAERAERHGHAALRLGLDQLPNGPAGDAPSMLGLSTTQAATLIRGLQADLDDLKADDAAKAGTSA